jgi:hypothetical protein
MQPLAQLPAGLRHRSRGGGRLRPHLRWSPLRYASCPTGSSSDLGIGAEDIRVGDSLNLATPRSFLAYSQATLSSPR